MRAVCRQTTPMIRRLRILRIGLFLAAAGFCLISRAGGVFVRIISTTNTQIVACEMSGDVVWTNSGVGAEYSIQTSTSLADDQWFTVTSGVSTSLTQKVWINAQPGPPYYPIMVQIKGPYADSYIGSRVYLVNNFTHPSTGGSVVAWARVGADRLCWFGQQTNGWYVARVPCFSNPVSTVMFQNYQGAGTSISPPIPASEWICND